ncbi:carbohydrate porin [Acinetobacter stercoris]|uniref:Porin B n=1 Tax=Acinetobacter stercoris TaxID=2126983 RepID=A0A2U3MY64_9GAMM|nr:carbohydrate porin [Acinetobacter stercoris]SPL70249.1 Porin B precursor [Acinetobacter stercoris]
MNKRIVYPVLACITLGISNQAYSESAFDPDGQYLFGDWNGKRAELEKKGIKFDANISLDTAYLADGGRNSGDEPTYASQLWLGSTFDMEKLAGWNDTVVRAIITARQGQSTSIRDLQDPAAPQFANVQANYGRGNTKSRLSELSIEKNFMDKALSIKAGRLGLGTDFNLMACDFQSTAFCSAQNGKWAGGIWYNIPVSQWGARVKYHITPEVFTQIGVYQYNPKNAREGQGWTLNFKGDDGITIPVEAVWQPKHGLNNLPGSYRIGGMYNTADSPKNQFDVKTGQGEDHTYAIWFSFEQQLTSVNGGKRGLHSFGNFTFHDDITNKITDTQQLGLKYIGLFDSQPNDTLGLGMNRVGVNDRYRDVRPVLNESAEYNIELNYTYNATKWLSFRPNIQYVINPGATSRVDDGLVLGLGTKLVF